MLGLLVVDLVRLMGPESDDAFPNVREIQVFGLDAAVALSRRAGNLGAVGAYMRGLVTAYPGLVGEAGEQEPSRGNALRIRFVYVLVMFTDSSGPLAFSAPAQQLTLPSTAYRARPVIRCRVPALLGYRVLVRREFLVRRTYCRPSSTGNRE